jgi:Zn-dependent protease with chaperone function
MELPEEVQPRPGVPLQLVLYAPITLIAWFLLATIGGLPEPLVRLGLIAIVAVALAIIWYQRVFFVYTVSSVLKAFKVLFMLPYFLGVFMPQLVLSFTVSLLLEPMVALVWRTRRYLADASAVQLTRNPQALAEGLGDLAARGARIPGGAWASPFFVIGGQVAQEYVAEQMLAEVNTRVERERAARGIDKLRGVQRRTAEAQLQLEMRRQVVMEQYGTEPQRVPLTSSAASTGKVAPVSGSGATFSGDVHGAARLHPPLNKRLERLRAYGAAVQQSRPAAGGFRQLRGRGLLWIPVSIVLMLILVVLMTFLIALLMAISLVCTGILMLAAYGVLSVLTPA